MAITWADVTAIAPELSTAGASTQTAILAVTELMVDADAWGDFADKGKAYLAAHLGAVSSSGSGAGSITSETIGPLSRSYAAAADDSSLGSTKYGAFYRVLLRLAVAMPGLVP